MYTIWKSFAFAAAHQLSGLPEGHKCARMHGHNYVVELELQALDVDEVGFVRDFGELKAFKQLLHDVFDHRVINDVLPGMNPTAENLAKYFVTMGLLEYPETVACRVWETETSCAEFRVTAQTGGVTHTVSLAASSPMDAGAAT